MQRLSLRFHQTRPVGDSLSRLSEDTWSIYSVTDGLLLGPVRQLFTTARVLRPSSVRSESYEIYLVGLGRR